MEYQEVIKHLKENGPDVFSSDGFQDGAIELLFNDLFHGLKGLVQNQDELHDSLNDLIYDLHLKLEWFVMSYCAEAYMQAKWEE